MSLFRQYFSLYEQADLLLTVFSLTLFAERYKYYKQFLEYIAVRTATEKDAVNYIKKVYLPFIYYKISRRKVL
ncbi:MAG: hypothetical protein D3907_00050 [Candidatus Electrothrix sp. AUS3]|nr:hypothetical protein [Candidatus Electrothrix gigas]